MQLKKIAQLVHRVSPLGVAESDLTWTPGKYDPGGSVREDGARSNGETRFVSPAVLCFYGVFFPSSGGHGLHRFFRRRLADSLAAQERAPEAEHMVSYAVKRRTEDEGINQEDREPARQQKSR